MFGAVSSTDGVLDSDDIDDAVGWYVRVGDGGLIGYNGKPGSCASFELVGDTRSTNRDLSVLRRGICVDTAAALELEFNASPASRRKSTMPASATFCWPTSEGVMRSPSAAVVLLAPDMEEADSKEGLL